MTRPTQTHPRQRLAAEQAALLAALVGQGPLPDGFDPGQAAATAEVLLRKRASGVAKAYPGLAHALGTEFNERFAAYASTTPLPRSGGARADGRMFAMALHRAGALPDEARRLIPRRTLLLKMRRARRG